MRCKPLVSDTTALVQSRQFSQHRHKYYLARLKSNSAINKQESIWSDEQLDMVCRTNICYQKADLMWSAEQLYIRCRSSFCYQQADADGACCAYTAVQLISLVSHSIDAIHAQAVLLLWSTEIAVPALQMISLHSHNIDAVSEQAALLLWSTEIAVLEMISLHSHNIDAVCEQAVLLL